MLLYAFTILVSAFLLFQVEPIIAKIILPWFGGSAAVWTICLLFFQLVLLFGYFYAHLVRRLRGLRIVQLHIGLLALSLISLPILPKPSWAPVGGEDPTWRILALLTATIGLPYFLLSTTGPLLQDWFARRYPGRPPYRLYALSNAGSMFALLSYPVLFEPWFTTTGQAKGWSAGYLAFAILCGAAAVASRYFMDKPHAERRAKTNLEAAATAPGLRLYLLWILLPACASILLLAVTNHITQDIASIPFLWVLPLSLYLLTFIICFDREKWYVREIFLSVALLAAVAMGLALNPAAALDIPFPSFAGALHLGHFSLPLPGENVMIALPIFAAGLFLVCMVCHGELVRLKPDPRYLTSFYLMISAGGALGGIFVGLIAPHVFRAVYELHIGLALFALLAMYVIYSGTPGWFAPGKLLALAAALAFSGWLYHQVRLNDKDYGLLARNFYGELKVEDPDDPGAFDAVRKLVHGAINHGEQFTDPRRRDTPTTYYSPNSGVGLAITEAAVHGPIRVGVIGLGTGTLAAYGRPGDYYRFYDINPLVVQIAHTEFTFVKDCAARLDIALGDARLSLEREPSEQFDVLAVDAFSGDSIPIHLLTREAFDLYFRHLKSTGVIAVHVSNKYLDLEPVVDRIADYLHKDDGTIDTEDDEAIGAFGSTWVLVTGRSHFFDTPPLQGNAKRTGSKPHLRMWTDNYSNLFQILK
jgi:SAM-dependent methyltransferase